MQIITINPKVHNDIFRYVNDHYEDLKRVVQRSVFTNEDISDITRKCMFWDFGGGSDNKFIAKEFVRLMKHKYYMPDEQLYEFVINGYNLNQLMNVDICWEEHLVD